MLSWLRGKAKQSPRPVPDRRFVRARFDVAQTTDENRRHWAAADSLSADAASTPEIRRIIRNRSRYEVANNSYARGIVNTLANDVIGTGPRLQLLTESTEVNNAVEAAFAPWAREVGLARKLRVMRSAKAVDGESFGLLVTNPRLRNRIKLDLKVIEADQVTSPDLAMLSANAVDGIVFDEAGNPVEYHVLKYHPGDNRGLVLYPTDYLRIPARFVLHYYRPERAGQSRGLPDIMPALPLFSQLRRYTLAVLAAAETAADFALVVYSDALPDEDASPEPMDAIELERRMATVLPGGWKLGQAEAVQPTTTYGDFKEQVINEIARCLNMPFNVAAGNSAKYNYASGRLDHQTYFKTIGIDQDEIERVILDRLFAAWLQEALTLDGFLPASALMFDELEHQWFWDGYEHVDPQKEASAQETRLANYTTTYAKEYARQGEDWEKAFRQRAREEALLKELGLPNPLAPAAQPTDTGENATE